MSTHTVPTPAPEPSDAARVDCPLACLIPAGVTLTEVPPSRHVWADVIRCPNVDECDRPDGRTFLVQVTEA